MKIHRAGVNVILSFFIIEAILVLMVYFIFNNDTATQAIAISSLLLFVFVVRFFRDPQRVIKFEDHQIVAPADGKVVVIEQVTDEKYSGEDRIQISIFMSVWNIHVNWVPVEGKILSTEHIDGKFLLAKQPKSSTENERTITMFESKINGSKIVVKQIAGVVARRIITYLKADDLVLGGEELGFIRFGSRVDVLLPLDYQIKSKLGDEVVGGQSVIAELKQ